MLRLFAAVSLFASVAQAQTYSGRLAAGDETLSSGEYVDAYTVLVQRGQVVRAVLTSQAFDTYLILKSPSDEQAEDDDCSENETTRSCAEFVADRDGHLRVLVTSFRPGESGDYQVTIEVGSAASAGHELAAGDLQLQTGEWYDEHTIRLAAGDTRRIVLRSAAFDPYLIALGPGEARQENDDCPGGTPEVSCLELVAEEAGDWRILATSYSAGESGAYTLDLGDAAGEEGDEPFQTHTGRLDVGDATLPAGEFADVYTATGTGQSLVVDLRSSDFDPYLVVESEEGERFDNDDYEGALDRSLLVLPTQAGARYTVTVTSFAAGETGGYRLDLRHEGAVAASGVRTETGRLAAGDDQLEGGEFVDRFTFSAVPGQRLRADLTSDDYDTYLIVQPPSGDVVTDDDGGGRIGHSQLDFDLTEPGTYTVFVTSYAAGETGDYRLALDLTERFGQESSPAESGGPAYATTGTSRLDLADTVTGRLEASDRRLDSGEYMDVHTFDGRAGEPMRVELTSDDFDTYLIVESPSGARLDNDDAVSADGRSDTGRSAVEFSMTESGRYRVIATSYQPGETGAYALRLTQDALQPDPLNYDRIMGLFVGISDYDRMSDLEWTAQDAVVARDAMLRAGMTAEDGVLLTDREATADNVQRAFRRLAAQADERTLLVLFFSGHGGQYAREAAQASDPDGLDESIELFDAPLLDDDLDVLLASVPAGRQLVVVDACYSGGFSKDVISRPGRMGLFSSEEDIVSAVASKFEAGGYLSHFFADAIARRQGDEDGNGAVTALELSHYLGRRYATEVQVPEAGAMRPAHDTRGEHQRLVVDRGSIGLYESLFDLRP